MKNLKVELSEAVARRCSVEKVFVELSQNLQESTCPRASFLIKLQASASLNKRLWHKCYLVNFAKFLRTPIFTELLWWLLLNYIAFYKVFWQKSAEMILRDNLYATVCHRICEQKYYLTFPLWRNVPCL